MKRQLFLIAAILAAAALLYAAIPAALAQSLSTGKGDLRVMTYNVNEGTDYREVQEATNSAQFFAGVGAAINQVRKTDPPARMKALATQIIAARPVLVSLQEVDRWWTGPLNPFTMHCGPVTLEYDMLAELMNALRQQGAHYKVAIASPNWELGPLPGLIEETSAFLCVKVADRVVILARTDLDSSKFQIINRQKHPFDNVLLFPTPLGTVPFTRSWASVDAVVHGKAFRFINTHLDSVDPNINQLQGGEIRLGPADTALPVIIGMDANSQAFPLPQGQTYRDFIDAGYKDVWSELFPDDPGLTCCQEQLDNNLESELYQRIDLLLTKGPIGAQNAALFGVTQASKTPGGLWPSDHAGVAAQVVVRSSK